MLNHEVRQKLRFLLFLCNFDLRWFMLAFKFFFFLLDRVQLSPGNFRIDLLGCNIFLERLLCKLRLR
jgi:hypothetical protein